MSLSLKQLIQWGIRKDRAAKDLQDSADARVRPDAISRNRRQDIDGDRSPELALIRNFRSADERLGPRVFLDPLEQELEATEKIPVKPLQVRPRRSPKAPLFAARRVSAVVSIWPKPKRRSRPWHAHLNVSANPVDLRLGFNDLKQLLDLFDTVVTRLLSKSHTCIGDPIRAFFLRLRRGPGSPSAAVRVLARPSSFPGAAVSARDGSQRGARDR